MRSNISDTVGEGALQDLCTMLEPANPDSAHKGTAECGEFPAFDCERGYKRKRTDPNPGLVADIAEALLSTKDNQGEDAVTNIMSIFQTAHSMWRCLCGNKKCHEL